MAERTVESGADTRSIVSLRSAQEKPDAQRVPAQQGDLLARFLNRAPGASTAGSHASALNRATGSAPSRGAGALLELQRKHGNRHVQRVLSLARQAGGESEVGPEVEAVIEGERGVGHGSIRVCKAKWSRHLALNSAACASIPERRPTL